MNESVQPGVNTEKRHKYSFGIPCSHCGLPVQLGHIWLKTDATLEDLRNADEPELGLLSPGLCENLDANGRKCNEETIVERVDLIFVGDSMQLPNTLASVRWKE